MKNDTITKHIEEVEADKKARVAFKQYLLSQDIGIEEVSEVDERIIADYWIDLHHNLVKKIVERCRELMDEKHPCEHSIATQTIEANGVVHYCCDDIHIGRREALADIVAELQGEIT